MVDQPRYDEMPDDELDEKLAEGDTTMEEVDESLQEEMRREAAEREPEDLLDDTERYTEGGFGSGQGMGPTRSGIGPNRPDERGYPRGENKEWPT